jgi:N-acetylmuramoyl-L-alanine amidase-like protein
MDASPPDPSNVGLKLSRRRLLRLAGTAGLAVATVGACSKAPAAPPAPVVSPSASTVVLCRNAWGALPPRPGGTPHTPNFMTIHHTAVVLGDNSNAPARLRQHQHYHQDSQGWIDIAYHFSVDRKGNIYQLRDPDLVGDTATRYDPTGHFLVVCEGDFDKEEVTEEQLDSSALVFAWAAQHFNIPTERLGGHRDASSDTACPGASLYGHVTSGDLRGRVDVISAAGPVDLSIICGPEAEGIVADIEAGLR